MKLKRFDRNPILLPRGENWEALAVFNCAAILIEGKIHVLYRAVGDYVTYSSRLGYAIFDCNLNLIKRFDKPVFEPDIRFWEMSIEDPRLVRIDNKIYVTYVTTPTPAPPLAVRLKLGMPKPKQAFPRCAIAEVKDFKEFTRLGTVTPYDAEERNLVLFPKRIDNKFAALHRPANWIGDKWSVDKPSIWFAWLDKIPDIMYGHKVVIKPEEDWEMKKIGAGPPPIETERGWILIYHAVDYNDVYRAGVALLDLHEPWKLISKYTKPILEPEKEYEVKGDVPNVVFPTGAVKVNDDLLVFYGAADKYCCVAFAKLDDIIKCLV